VEKIARDAIRFRSRAIAQGWLWRHESGVYVQFTATGAELFT
jgi:hypothetical protein